MLSLWGDGEPHLAKCGQMEHTRPAPCPAHSASLAARGLGSPVAHRDHPALRGHEGGPVAEAQLGLQRVEVDLQLALLLHLGRLVQAPVVTEVLQLLLHGVHGVLGRPVLQPWDGAADPLQQLRGAGGSGGGRWEGGRGGREHLS